MRKKLIKDQLLATIPPEQAAPFSEHLFRINVPRFAVQCLVLLVLDACSLLFYCTYQLPLGPIQMQHVVAHVGKMLLMIAGAWFFVRLDTRSYERCKFLDRNIDVLWPCVYIVSEIFLFATGPRLFSGFVRFLAIPFVMAALSTMRQRRSFCLQAGIFAVYTLYLSLYPPYQPASSIYGILINVWLVAFISSLGISFASYSLTVNSYLSGEKEQKAVRDLFQINKKLQRISQQDYLTGLLNRRGLLYYLDSTWEAKAEAGATIGLMMVDIDYFKRYNDRFGHLRGDGCLIKVTDCLHIVMQEEGMHIARFGGEEFTILGYEKSHEAMVQLAERVRQCVIDLKVENPDSSTNPYLTISVGVVSRPVEWGVSYDDLVDAADRCLYYAKHAGRNMVVHMPDTTEQYYDVKGRLVNLPPTQTQLSNEFDEEFIQQLLQDICAGCTLVYDAKRDILEFSKPATEIFGLPTRIVSPTISKLAEFIRVELPEKLQFFKALEAALASQQTFFSKEAHLQLPDYSYVPVTVQVQFSRNDDGSLAAASGSLIDIQKAMEYKHYLNRQTKTNSITQLPNRQKLYEDMSGLLQLPEQTGYMLLLDISGFKRINSLYSHGIGDKVLQVVAGYLNKLAGEHAPVYNYGIDQFVIVTKNASRSDVESLMNDIRQYFANDLVIISGLDLRVKFVMAALHYSDKKTVSKLFVNLDIALQMAKYKHQSQIFFSEVDREEFMRHTQMVNSLRQAVERGCEGFLLHYQPIVHPHTRKCIGCEALLRWKDSDGKIIPPLTVIPLLERERLMAVVEQWIFNEALRQCRQWIDAGASEDFFVQINLSPEELGRDTLHEEVCEAVQRHGLGLHNVALEVTETSGMLEKKSALNVLQVLRREGIKIAIDDFGTGYSSLSYLGRLPADEVKIDRSFVANVDSDATSRAFLSSIVSMAKSMGYLVCVEGVEKHTQHNIIDALGVDFLQGYLYGKPMQADEFYAEFIAAKTEVMQ